MQAIQDRKPSSSGSGLSVLVRSLNPKRPSGLRTLENSAAAVRLFGAGNTGRAIETQRRQEGGMSKRQPIP